jgi:cysteinyl-tRNA synthetase
MSLVVEIFKDFPNRTQQGPFLKKKNGITNIFKMREITMVLMGLLFAQTAHTQSRLSSFAYVLQADSLAKSKPDALKQLSGCQRDWIILDSRFSAEEAWTRGDLDAIRSKWPDRKILAYVSIGEAEDYRSYWQSAWTDHGRLTSTAPPWLLNENPEWHGNFRVRYWKPDWQKLILAQVDDVMNAGFDGVYLDIVDGFETFELNNGSYEDHRLNPETKQTFRRDMVDWVSKVALRARATNPSALVIPQNGSQLLRYPDFHATISGIGIEDLFTEGNKLQSQSHTREVLSDLEQIQSSQKPVLLIEYPTRVNRQSEVEKLANEHNFIWLITDRELRSIGHSGK